MFTLPSALGRRYEAVLRMAFTEQFSAINEKAHGPNRTYVVGLNGGVDLSSISQLVAKFLETGKDKGR